MLTRDITKEFKKETAIELVKISKSFNYDKAHQASELEVDEAINDIENNPHLFVLACLMDKQIDANRAWAIPVIVCKELCQNDFSFDALVKLSFEELKAFFNERKLHRFNNEMATVFYKAIQRIQDIYDGRANEIWDGNNPSSLVISRFSSFHGCGPKIATMATNLLHRIYGITYTDYSALDASPDVHVCRVLYRLGQIGQTDDVDTVIYRAREINPEYPGLIDKCCWNVGRDYCHPSNPECGECPLTEICYSKKNKDFELPQ
jgi:endonuclease III